MSQTELSSSAAAPAVDRVDEHAAEHAADVMIERRYPSDIDRLREVVGTDVLPHYRDEQAIVASEQASERWPHLVAVADARAGAASVSSLSQSSKRSAGAR